MPRLNGPIWARIKKRYGSVDMTRNEAKDKIIFALDVDNLKDIDGWAERLSNKVGMFKVGKELFTSAGPAAVEAV